jgi:hypothetical protein
MEMIMSTLVKAVLIPTVISASSVAFPRLGAAKPLRLDGGNATLSAALWAARRDFPVTC